MNPYFADIINQEKFREILTSWLGTPYRRNVAIKGRGADCSLFIAAALVEAGILCKIEKPEYLPRDWHIHGEKEIFLEYFRKHKAHLAQGFHVQKIENENYIFGDWLIFELSTKKLRNHSSIFCGDGEVIHAAERIGVVVDKFSRWEKFLSIGYRLYFTDTEGGN